MSLHTSRRTSGVTASLKRSPVADVFCRFCFTTKRGSSLYVIVDYQHLPAAAAGYAQHLAEAYQLSYIQAYIRRTGVEINPLELEYDYAASYTLPKDGSNKRDAEARARDRENSVRYFLNIGKRDMFDKPTLVKLVCSKAGVSEYKIIDVKIRDTYSFVQVTLDEAEKVCEIDSLDEFTIHVFYRAVRSPEAPPPPANSELRGFDRLLRMNYSQNEISDLRHRFHSMHGTLDASGDARLELEEEWFPVIFNQENPLEDLRIRRGNNGRENTTPLDPIEEEEIPPSFLQFLTGLTVGVLLGVPALALVTIGQVLETRLRDRWFLAGALAGSCGHYLMRMLLGYM